MFESLLVPVDGSELSRRAVAYAQVLALPAGRLTLMRAAEAHTLPGGNLAAAEVKAVEEAERSTSALCQNIAASGAHVASRVYYGPPAEAIQEEVHIAHADTIVMSTHGRGGLGKLVYGSVAEKVVKRASVPVVLIPANCNRPWPPAAGSRIIVPLDRSSLAETAVGPAIELARKLSAGLLLIGLVPPAYAGFGAETYPSLGADKEVHAVNDYLDALASAIRRQGIACSTLANIADPCLAIAEMADGEDVAAIVMATHGRSGILRLSLGSVAAAVLQRAQVPVLVVRPAAVNPTTAATELAAAHSAV